MRKLMSVPFVVLAALVLIGSSGCTRTEAKPPAQQALPVKVVSIDLSPVPRQDE